MTTTTYPDDTARNWRLAPRSSAVDDARDRLDLEVRLAEAEGDDARARRLGRIADALTDNYEG